MPTFRKIHTTRPGCQCSSREKKLDQDSEPEYAFVVLILIWESTTKKVARAQRDGCGKVLRPARYCWIGWSALVRPTLSAM